VKSGAIDIGMDVLKEIGRNFLMAVPAIRRHRARGGRTSLVQQCGQVDERVRVAFIDIGSRALVNYCRRHQVDVLLPSFHAMPHWFEIPYVGYIFDFQHKHLPHLFTSRARLERDKSFSKMVSSASAVIVNSASVESDAIRYLPHSSCRFFALPFSADTPRVVAADPDRIRAHYGVRGRYFMVCNQFWCHKDHETAFRAFAALAGNNAEASHSSDLALVCTGLQHDYRNPDHMRKLRCLIDELGVASKIFLLGVIPKADQLGLMSGCVAVIQPTWCEGGPGGGSVYEAVGLGVRSIVSDIPVNLELDEPSVTFFQVGNAVSLLEQMRAALAVQPQTPSQELLKLRGQQRRRACGKVLMEAINYVVRER
jgi:glycosyltransferase involved in cell wall biosynthesis